MKARRKWNRLFAMLLVATLIFNSQATALLAMDGESFGVAGDKTELFSGTGGSAEIIDEGDTQIIPDGEVEASSFGSGTQAGNGQDNSFLLGQEVVPGTAPVADQEKESEADTLTEAEKEMLTDPSDPENGSGADEESGPALGVEEDSDITIVEEETEPQTSEQEENAQEAEEDGTDGEDDIEIMAMGLDDGIMLTGLDDPEAKVIKAGGGSEEYATFAEAVAAARDGDTVQLLRDTKEIGVQIQVSKSIAIDLDGHNLIFSSEIEETTKNKNTTSPKLAVLSEATLTIMGSGSITGGCYETCTDSKGNKSKFCKTIEVIKGGNLIVQDQVKVDVILNYGSTELKNDVQVGKIRQLGNTFVLDNVLTVPLEIMIGIDEKNNTNYLKLGDNFNIGENVEITISFYLINMLSSLRYQSGVDGGTKVLNGKNGTWLAKPDQDNPFALMLFTPENIANNDILNMLAEKIDIPNIVEGEAIESKKDEYGYPMKDEDGNTIYIEKKKTAEVRVENGSVVLRKFYRYEDDEPDKEPEETDRIYVSNKGEDSNGRGFSSALPVKTMTKAIELVKKDTTKKKIYILDTLEINDTQEWGDLPEGVTIERYEGFAGAFAKVVENGTLTLKNIEIKGDITKLSDSALIEVSTGGKLVLNENAVLSNNDHDHSKSSSYGGAIKNNGGTIEINGGTIKNCKAYNGGAIYCNGGKLIMDNGLLTENSAVEAGGAIMLANGAVMELNDGEISGNDTALHKTGKAYGGGIAVGGYTSDSIQISPELHMTGGTITNNKATRCGGGIFVQANAKAWITGGTISNNGAQTEENYGGGGIYVNGARGEIDKSAEEEGYLYLENVLITGNYANKTRGGGIAGCDTSSVCIYLSKGAAIYGNTWYYGYGYDHYKSDIFIARSPYSNTDIDISEYARSGQPYLWKEEDSNNDVAANTLHKNMALDLYTDEPFSENEDEYNVVIKGNHSEVSGGGIGTNGTVVIGTEPEVTSITAKKVWNDEGNTTLRPDQIKVWLLRRKRGESKYERVAAEYIKPDAKGNWGSVSFTDQPVADPTDSTPYEYTVEEDTSNLSSVYKVTVTEDSGADGNAWIITNTYKAAAGSIQLGATKAFDRTLTGGEFTFMLQEVDSTGKTVAEGVNQKKTNGGDGKILFDEITYNEAGTYYYQISEVAGFDPTILSYDTAVKTVTVTVKDVDAKLVATADQTADEVVFTNTSVKAKIDKQDADTGASIPGAVLRIVDKKNADAVVEQWTSNGKPHEIIGKLSKNGSYVLEEVTAPDGYLPTGPIDFTVNEKGETIIDGIVTDVVVMKDTKNTISLLKVDESGQPLAGAHLVIENAEGTAMDSWVSDGKPHETRGLARGHYVMSEVEAPAGYHVAEDVPFEITGDETEPVEVRMADKKIPVADNNKLTVMKHLKLDGITCDIGIHEAEFYVALFSDEERTHRVSDVKKIEFHDNALSTVTFENLGRGTYYVGETDENGVLMLSKKVNDQVIYYAEYGENSSVQFEGSTGEGTAELTNVYVEFPEERYYLSGRLTITKNVLVEGQEAASDDTFYAGIFSDTALTSRVGDVVAIEMNGGSSASVTVYNLAIGESIDSSETYYVAETDANGTPLNPDEIIEYRISVDKSEIIMDADHADQEVVITNDFVEEFETEEEEEEEENISDSSGSGPESGTTAPKTGNETDSVLYLLYMALSAGVFAVTAEEKHRRQRRVKK